MRCIRVTENPRLKAEVKYEAHPMSCLAVNFTTQQINSQSQESLVTVDPAIRPWLHADKTRLQAVTEKVNLKPQVNHRAPAGATTLGQQPASGAE